MIEHQNIHDIENNDIWGKKVVGKTDVDIAALITKLNCSDWVNQGRDYLQAEEVCPFCQQPTITIDFRNKLEGFFDESFTTAVKLVQDCQSSYVTSMSLLLNNLSALEVSEKTNNNTKLVVELYSAHLKALESQYSKNKDLLNLKSEKLSRSIELVDTSEEFQKIVGLIVNANKEIDKHNIIVDNFKNEQGKLVSDIWKYLANEAVSIYENNSKECSGLQKGIVHIESQFKDNKALHSTLDAEIKELNKNVTSVQPAVDEINKLLTSFGFHNFILVPSPIDKNHYQLQRDDGSFAHSTLSEGEITFITFLYYLQWVKGAKTEDAVTNDKIIVIDDPICSLDSNVLFVVSSLVKEVIKDIKKGVGRVKQLFLLTHNVYFHKEVSFIDGRTKKSNLTHYWILRKINKGTKIQSYEQANPIESSYELLWREIKEWQKNSGITIQNTMRRIIENYFKILGKYGDDDLINKFNTREEKEVCRSLLYWINDGSHCMPDDLYIQAADDSIEKYQLVFKGIFEHTDNIGHYNMMMGVQS